MDARSFLRRDPWHVVWRIAAEGRLLAGTLLGLAIYLALPALIPQIPPEPLATDRWLAQAQARFGTATGILYRLGLFSLAESPLPRLILTFLGSLLLVGGAVQIEQALSTYRSDQRHGWLEVGAAVAGVLAYLGPLLLLLGLLVNQLWGWRVEGVIGHPGEPVEVPGYGTVPLRPDPSGIHSARSGVSVYVIGSGPELRVRAYDASGDPLPLRRTSREAARQELILTLSLDTPEAFFAVSDVGLVGRISSPDALPISAGGPLHLQLFRSPTGAQVYQIDLTDEGLEVEVDGIRLEIVRSSYLLLAADHHPGRWLEGVGAVLGAFGLLGMLLWEGNRNGRKGATRAFVALLTLLTLAVAGMAMRNLIGLGLLWDRSAVQMGLTAIWLALLAGELFLRSPRWVERKEEKS